MANNYLITGYWGEPHVTAENDRGIHAAAFGTGRFILPVGKQFNAEYVGNNTIRMYDGKLIDNGAVAGIPAGEYVDLLISNVSSAGMKRKDLIIFQYSKDTSTLIESGTFVVVQGKETSGTPSAPELTQNDLLTGTATVDQMALWSVTVEGTTINAPIRVCPVKWQNPPLDVGIEYQTAEYFAGKPVYIKHISGGAMPSANATKNVAHGVENMGYIVDFGGCMTTNGRGAISLPYYFASDNCARLSVTNDNFVILSGSNNVSSYNDVRLWVKYTKTTD